MFLVKNIILIAVIQFSLVQFVGAEEEHGGGGAAAAEPAVDKEYSGSQNQDWVEFQKKLAELKGKLNSQQNLVNGLIIAKSNLTPEERSKKAEEIQVEHRKLQKMVEEYNQRSADYETKFPEKGVKESRIYKRIDSKSIESMENDLTLDGRLSQLHGKIIKQYPRSADAAKNKSKNTSKKNKNEKIEPATSTEKDVTDQIILQK